MSKHNDGYWEPRYLLWKKRDFKKNETKEDKEKSVGLI